MSETLYADVIVDISHESLDRTFEYRVPPEFSDRLAPGSRVLIPFGKGNRRIEGYVISLKKEPSFDPDRIKDIEDLVPGSLSVEEKLIRLADFMRKEYGSTMIQALKTVLPVKQKIRQNRRVSVELVLSPREADQLLREWERKHYSARCRLLRTLAEHRDRVYDAGLLVRSCGVSMKDIRKLEDQGILRLTDQVTLRRGFPAGPDAESPGREKPLKLNEGQQKAVDTFAADYEKGIRQTYLLFGVTGSGKTEVYLSMIEGVLAKGRTAIMLIPEISLTYQNVIRFRRRFGDRIAVLHSKMSAGEKSDETLRIRKGEARVVIGARSALFAPLHDLGLIIIDEEHDGAYKSDASPKYHARETAVCLAGLSHASLVLGSATPSLESFSRAKKGEYRLLTLPARAGRGLLPRVSIADLREEFARGNRGIFSQDLLDLMEDRLAKKEQIMLFLNRRGFAGFVSCRSCGQVMQCPHCDVSLTYHRDGSLRCHYCGYETRYSRICPTCGKPYVAAFGLGTEKVEAALHQIYPAARILRMDADTTRRKHGHEQILQAFSAGEADILLGTQMIVKGHDYHNVTLVGILAADMSLNSADYRSGERTFQLLSQAAGRAGRGDKAGQVLIQTYTPDHYAIRAAVNHDYEAFFEEEYSYRELMGYPPCGHLLVILIQSADESAAILASQRIRAMIRQSLHDVGEMPAILNPGKAALAKIKDSYRQVLYLKHNDGEMLRDIRLRLEPVLSGHPMFAGIHIQFDYDPMNRY